MLHPTFSSTNQKKNVDETDKKCVLCYIQLQCMHKNLIFGCLHFVIYVSERVFLCWMRICIETFWHSQIWVHFVFNVVDVWDVLSLLLESLKIFKFLVFHRVIWVSKTNEKISKFNALLWCHCCRFVLPGNLWDANGYSLSICI